MTAAPNPFETSTRIVLRRASGSGGLAEGAPVTILDASGRKVRELVLELIGDELHTAWDGNDAGGRRVAAGVYYARILEDGAAQESPLAGQAGTRIVRIR